MYIFSSPYYHKIYFVIVFLILPCFLFAFPEIVESENKRLLIGIELFPSFLASDQHIKEKKDQENLLNILVLYQYDRKVAEDITSRLKSLGKIRGIAFRIIIASVNDIQYSSNQPIAGVFIAESLLPLEPIIKKSIDHHYIVFSPFEGDVERGITGGIHISEKIVPFVNMSTLKKANIQLKSFFLRVSKKYE